MKQSGLKDVAERSGTSVSTVSMVLNGRGAHYAARTRERIRRAVDELGYRPNAFARSVQCGRYGTVALVMSPEDHRSTLPSGVLKGISEALMARYLHLDVAYIPDAQLTSAATLPRLLREGSCDGMLLNYHAHVPPQLEELVERHRLPVVWINAKRAHDCVYPDDLGAGVRAAEALLAAGHRRIAYVDIMYHRAEHFDILHFSKTDRLDGYRQAMRQAGLPSICVLPEDARDGSCAMQRLLRGANPITAAIGYTHLDAEVIALAAARAGLAIPADVSLVTFSGDNTPIGALKVTLMAIPERQVGQTAVEMLLEKIRNPRQVLQPRILDFAFDAGETLAPARGRADG